MTVEIPDGGTLLLKVDDIMARLKVSRPQAYAMMADGTLPVVRIGRLVRVPAEELDRWIEAKVEREVER